jgi:antitoxin component of MazEF toxin-antitoxin module
MSYYTIDRDTAPRYGAEEPAMIKRLVRHGNSRALIIDKPILELLGANGDNEFEITTDGKSLTITPITPAGDERRQAFERALEDANENWGGLFKRLAE